MPHVLAFSGDVLAPNSCDGSRGKNGSSIAPAATVEAASDAASTTLTPPHQPPQNYPYMRPSLPTTCPQTDSFESLTEPWPFKAEKTETQTQVGD